NAASVPCSYDVTAVVRYAVCLVNSSQAKTCSWVQLAHLDDFDVTFSGTANTALTFTGNIIFEVYKGLIALDNAVTQVGLAAAVRWVWSTQCRGCAGVINSTNHCAV